MRCQTTTNWKLILDSIKWQTQKANTHAPVSAVPGEQAEFHWNNQHLQLQQWHLQMVSAGYTELKLYLLIDKEQETQLGIPKCYLTLWQQQFVMVNHC